MQSLPPLSLAEADDDHEAYLQWRALNDYITDGPCREWVLVDRDTGDPVWKNAKAYDFRGDSDTIIGGRAPHKPGSTGKVWTADGREYYPGVFDMKWVDRRG